MKKIGELTEKQRQEILNRISERLMHDDDIIDMIGDVAVSVLAEEEIDIDDYINNGGYVAVISLTNE